MLHETAPVKPKSGYLLSAGDVVAGRHLICRPLGRGGMGEVYEAHDQLLNEPVALKTLRANLTWDQRALKRFQVEIQLARKVTHPNVCRLYEAGLLEGFGAEQGRVPFFIMELLQGESLSRRIRRAGRLSREEAFPLAVQMAQGLQAAHSAGIVHSDFKSGNVILVSNARAVITDFGLSHLAPGEGSAGGPQAARQGAMAEGTMAYMSPEQLTGGPVTAASDIYSFGIVLFEMATGRLPFDERHILHGAMQRAAGEGSHARDIVPNLDPRWNAAIARCLQNEPGRRFSSAGEVAAFLEGRGWRYWTRRDWTLRFAALAVSACAAGLWWWHSRQPYSPRPEALDWYRKGVSALHSMTFEAARKSLEQAVRSDPNFALAHALLARAYQELNYTEAAKESMLRAMTVAQDFRLSSRDQLRLRAAQFVVSREFDRAAQLFQQFEEEAPLPEKPAAALEAGWLAQQNEDTDTAAKAYARALEFDPTYAAATLRIGYIHGRRRQIAKAIKAYSDAESLYTAESNFEGVTECLLQKAVLINRSTRAAEALDAIERALGISAAVGSSYQQIRLQLAKSVAIRNRGDTAHALTLTQAAIDRAISEKMDNLATTALIDLGNVHFVSGDLAEAERTIQRARELAARSRIRPLEARALLSLGSIYENSGRPEQALQAVEASLPFYRLAGYRREYVQAMTILGRVHGQRGDFDQGIRVLRSILPEAERIQDRISEGYVHERLAENLRDQAAWPEALREYERATKLIPPNPLARLHCAELSWKLGRRQEALSILAQLESQLKGGRNPRELRLLLRMQSHLAYLDSRLPAAAALARQSAALSPNPAADLTANLALVLVSLRSEPSPSNLAQAIVIVNEFDRLSLPQSAAAARLDVAEALMLAPAPTLTAKASALPLARDAAAFYDPRRISESAWRAHWSAARATQDPGDSENHKTAARAALEQLNQQWPADVVARYLKRPEIGRLLNLMAL